MKVYKFLVEYTVNDVWRSKEVLACSARQAKMMVKGRNKRAFKLAT